jgi:hypothetical protein
MTAESSTNSWEKALSFYDNLTGAGWAHIPAFRALVSAIATSQEAGGLTAVTSHEVLTISPYTRYPDWFEGRRLQLHPKPDETVRIVKYSERKVETWTLPFSEALAKAIALLPDLKDVAKPSVPGLAKRKLDVAWAMTHTATCSGDRRRW